MHELQFGLLSRVGSHVCVGSVRCCGKHRARANNDTQCYRMNVPTSFEAKLYAGNMAGKFLHQVRTCKKYIEEVVVECLSELRCAAVSLTIVAAVGQTRLRSAKPIALQARHQQE